MKVYKYLDLLDKTETELQEIKKEKQNELYEIQSRKLVIIGNIMSLQNTIKIEALQRNDNKIKGDN